MTTVNTPSPSPASDLPTDVAACHAMIVQLLDSQRKLEHTVERLEYRLQEVLRRLYGRSSERIDPNVTGRLKTGHRGSNQNRPVQTRESDGH